MDGITCLLIYAAGLFYGFIFGMMYESYLRQDEYLKHKRGL